MKVIYNTRYVYALIIRPENEGFVAQRRTK